MTGIELVKQYFPSADEQMCDWILWNRTGFPDFYHGDPIEFFGKQLEEYKRLIDAGKDVCDFCNGEVVINNLCQRCYNLAFEDIGK